MSRPEHLPDFDAPPVVEVLLSVQFPTPPAYQHVYAAEVWGLFRDRFPQIAEQPPLAPTFEVFGNRPSAGMSFSFAPMSFPMRNRYWFLDDAGFELLQFQADRFMHNWRSQNDPNAPYPHFDPIVKNYAQELEKLDKYFQEKGWGSITPNQCELTYINQMPLIDSDGQPRQPSFYLRNINPTLGESATDFVIRLQTDMLSSARKPIGRLIIDASTATDVQDKRILSLTLTVRGAPATPTIADSLAFLHEARNLIVTSFTEITSPASHKLWKRNK